MAVNLRDITKQLRELNLHYDGPGSVCLNEQGSLDNFHQPGVRFHRIGCEELPGDGRPFDAVAAARRLLAAWRDAVESGLIKT